MKFNRNLVYRLLMTTITILIFATLLVSCGLVEYIKPKHEHSFVGNKCEECGELKDSIGLAYTVNGEGTCRIDGLGTCADTDVKIPEYIDGYKVTEIKNHVFYSKKLASITIPNTVTKIGEGVLAACGGLEKITVEEGNPVYHSAGNCLIETASKTVIGGCKNSVIPADGSVTVIGSSAFESCVDLFSIVIPEGVTSIESGAFIECVDLWSVTIPQSVTNIGEAAFKYCPHIVEVINRSDILVLAGSVNSGYIAQNAKEVHSGTTKIVNQDGYLFYTCDEVNYLLDYIGSASKLTLPGTYNGQPYEIYEAIFSYDENLVSIVISPGVTAIADSMFYNCVNLVNVTIPDSVTTIGQSSFEGCVSLANVIIPDSVTSIGGGAFRDCKSITSIVIPDNVTIIDGSTFYNCKSLTSIVIPDNVTSIGSFAFYGCSGITSMVIPDSVTSIGMSAFSCGDNLVSIVFENPNGWHWSNKPGIKGHSIPESEFSDPFMAVIYLRNYGLCYLTRF